MELAVLDLVQKRKARLASADLGRLELDLVQDVLEVLVELVDGEAVRGVERQRDHGFDARQIDLDAAVVVGDIGGLELAVVALAAVLGEERAGVLVGRPDGAKAGGLGRHDVDAVAIVGRHARDAGAHELHDLVLHVAALEDGADDSERDVVRAHAGTRGAGEVDGDDAGVGDVVGVLKQLLGELAAALADGHGAQGAVAGVGVGAEDHLAAAGEVLAHEGVDDGDVGRNEDAAVALRGRKAEDVVVLVDGAAHGAQRVMAVGEHVRQRELLHARGARRLDDADEGDVVARHGIEANLERVRVARGVVRLEDRVGDGSAPGVGGGGLDAGSRGLAFRDDLLASAQVDTLVVQLDHADPALPRRPPGPWDVMCADGAAAQLRRRAGAAPVGERFRECESIIHIEFSRGFQDAGPAGTGSRGEAAREAGAGRFRKERNSRMPVPARASPGMARRCPYALPFPT